MDNSFDVSREVSTAVELGKPVVALESAFLTHGLPHPVNIDTAAEMHNSVRSAGAVPAMVGIVDGVMRIGLTDEEIAKLAKGDAEKASARDIAYMVKKKFSAGTTVSATMRIAACAHISIMATGGIGGVHRGFDMSGDVSADLWEMVRTPMIVVCSGPKAILDIPRTSEWLETHSVPVYGFATDTLPAFYCGSSGVRVPRLDDAKDVAGFIKTATSLGSRTAIIIGVEVSKKNALDLAEAIEQAVKDAAKNGISGKNLTPYLLSLVAENSGGKAIEANRTLLADNARVAAEIAVEMSKEDDRRIGFMV